MEYFRSFLRVIGLLEPAKVDFISELPLEVSQLILRKLDPETLLSAAQVSRKWLEICTSDKSLRRSARRHKRRTYRQRREQFEGIESLEQSRVTVPRKVRVTKRLPRDPPYARFEAAVVFGKIQQPRSLPKRTEVQPILGVRTSKCIRI
ncbi:uncharacterized protein LOC143188121 [Calliopsis andreniformis]|uniref:uncharacterized protein LOC143188121 n=1 Tax=Calliopsis andreniformis TaxID=337506 RepID=UPI003FCD0902